MYLMLLIATYLLDASTVVIHLLVHSRFSNPLASENTTTQGTL